MTSREGFQKCMLRNTMFDYSPPNFQENCHFAKLSSVKFSASQVELKLALLSLNSHPTRVSIFEPLLDYPGSWYLVWKLYSTRLSQLATETNLPNQIYCTKSYQPKCFQLNLQNQIHQTNSSKPNLEKPNLQKIKVQYQLELSLAQLSPSLF